MSNFRNDREARMYAFQPSRVGQSINTAEHGACTIRQIERIGHVVGLLVESVAGNFYRITGSEIAA